MSVGFWWQVGRRLGSPVDGFEAAPTESRDAVFAQSVQEQKEKCCCCAAMTSSPGTTEQPPRVGLDGTEEQ